MPSTIHADTTRFLDVTPLAPNLGVLRAKAADIVTRLEILSDVDELLTLLCLWEETRCEVDSYAAHVDLMFNIDTTDAGAKAAREAWERDLPAWIECEISVKRALLAHPARAALEQRMGTQAFALWESEALSFAPEIKADLTREKELEAEYNELLAGATFDFRGEELTHSTVLAYRNDPDRDVRHESEGAQWAWFAANAEQLDRIFDDLVTLRHGIARKLGMRDAVELGYKRMCRVDYGRADVERFREQIVREVVPLAARLREEQREALGVDELMAWDEHVSDPRGNPAPCGDRAWQVARAREMFDSMGEELGAFFRRMDDGGFLDLDSRKGKAGGGFCTAFPAHGMPFVFANFNGSKGDVEVLTHEIGHAFQTFKSREQWPKDYHWPTYEACEVHSMGLEFLTWPHMDAFFGDEGDRFRRVHLTESLLFLTYGTAVDHFQHLIYEQPNATPAERNQMWLEMERTYLPWRRWGDLSHCAGGGRWQLQRHIYFKPFYYIDYVLAQTCALQYLAWAERDRAAAMESYVELCGRGGSLPFQALVRSAGLTSPFDEGCLERVVATARGLAMSSP